MVGYARVSTADQETGLQLLGSFAEFERGVMRERCAAGREAAAARGVRFGRPAGLDRARVLELRAAGLSWRDVAGALQASRAACRKAAAGVRRCDGGLGEHAARRLRLGGADALLC